MKHDLERDIFNYATETAGSLDDLDPALERAALDSWSTMDAELAHLPIITSQTNGGQQSPP